MSDFFKIGKFGEDEAVRFLENRDYNIIARNFLAIKVRLILWQLKKMK